jgi:hypothetical protein
MSQSPERKANEDLMWLSALFAAAIVAFNLWMATTRHDNSRDQHLAGAVSYAKGHIDLLRPEIPGFNANGSPTPLEFPIWQALTAVLMKAFGIWYGWGNIVSMAFLFSSLWALFDLVRRRGSSRLAWWTILFSLAQPLNMIIGAQAGGDSTAWAFAMWFVYFSYRMAIESKLTWWLLALLSGGLSALTKAPFFMCAGLTAFFWVWCWRRNSVRAWAFLISTGVICAALVMVWNVHCHHVYREAEFSTINLDPLDANSGIHHWYFGTLSYRLNYANWLRGGWHLSFQVLAGFSLIFLVLFSIRVKQAAAAWLWMLAAVCTTVVFPELVLEHWHYFFIFAPATAWLCAVGANEIEGGIWDRLRASPLARASIILGTLVPSLAGTLMCAHVVLLFDPWPDTVGQLVKQHTSPKDKLIVWGPAWGANWGDPFFRAGRQGLTATLERTDTSWLNDPKKLARLKQLGYNKIVLINPSPKVTALGSLALVAGREQKFDDLRQLIPAIAKHWPVVFDSPFVLIAQIPD